MLSSVRTVRRVALYARVSIERDARSKSVDDQLAEMREWATREGWQIVAEHRDDGVSASRFAAGRVRPGWQSAMENITGGNADALLCWEVSRASRDRPVFAALYAALAETGTLLGTGGRLHDLGDPDDGFSLDLGAALAVRESNVISKRTRRAVESRAAAGRPAGSVPYGYRRLIDPDTGRTVGRGLHDDQAPIVEEIVERLLAREPAHAIAADLNDRAIPTGVGERWLGRHLQAVVKAAPDHPITGEIVKRLAAGELPGRIAADLNEREVVKPIPSVWAGGNLARLALRPTYAGLRVHHGRVLDDVRGTWPAIITEQQHHELVALFASPERDKFRNSTVVRHLGVGIYQCGRDGCTGRMRVVASQPPAYSCRVCHKISRHQEPVDARVEDRLLAILSRPEELAALDEGDDTEAAAAADEVRRLRAKLEQARRAWDDDQMSLEAYTDMEARTLPKIRAAEQRAQPARLPAAVAEVAGPDAAARWHRTPVAQQRAILDALLVVTILPVGRGGRPFEPASVRVERRRI